MDLEKFTKLIEDGRNVRRWKEQAEVDLENAQERLSAAEILYYEAHKEITDFIEAETKSDA